MFHLLFDDRPWFAPRNGQLLPRTLCWQGRAVGAMAVLLLAGIGVLWARGNIGSGSAIVTIVAACSWTMLIVWRRTARMTKQ